MKRTKALCAWIVFPPLVLSVGLWWGGSSISLWPGPGGSEHRLGPGPPAPTGGGEGQIAGPPSRPPSRNPPPLQTPPLNIPHGKQKLIGLRTTTAGLQSLTKNIRTVGRIEIDERKQAFINAKVEGWIEKLYVNATGATVKQGQPIAEIYSPELLATQQELLNMLRWKKSVEERRVWRPLDPGRRGYP